MAEQRYNITESTALLDIDRVTLTRWLRAERMEPHSDPRDRRYKYLTREQLAHLATVHDKVIREEPLRIRLTGIQREIIARLERLEEQHAELRRLLESRTVMPRSYSVSAPEPHQTPVLVKPAPEYPTLPRTPDFDYSAYGEHARTAREYRPRERLRKGEWHTLPPIPAGWLSPGDFARLHNIPERTLDHHLRPRYAGDKERAGTLDYHSGRWQRPHVGNYATELFDLEQQEAARAEFSGRDGADDASSEDT